MRSNLTIIEQNTMLGLEHDDTQELYLRGAQKDERRAFLMADEWQRYLRPFLQIFQEYYHSDRACTDGYDVDHGPSGKACDEVIEFVKERQFRRYFPNQ